MILRRFREHVERQNWFAVLLELAVVIAGIYIGLQADSWMAAREERRLEVEYLERLLDDMRDSISAQEEQIKSFDEDTASIDYIAQLQRSGSFEGADVERVRRGLNSINWVAPPATNMITVHELQSTGNISLIRDVSIRKAIGEFERSYSALEFESELIANLMAASAPEVMTWSYMKPNTPGEHRSVTSDEDSSWGYVNLYDAERMLKNPDAAKITSWISGWSKYQGSIMVRHHRDTIQFRDLLKQKLENL